MRQYRVCVIVALQLALCGCAGSRIQPERLLVTITPETVYPGCVVSLQVKAPLGTTDVRGRLDLFGSPVVPLTSDDRGRTWVFITQIPIDAVWQPGKYRAIVEGNGPDGSRLQGEAWVNAP